MRTILEVGRRARALSRVALFALGAAAAGCGSDKDRTFVDPYGTSTEPFPWPEPGAALPASALRLEPAMGVAYFDLDKKAGIPLPYKVVEVASGTDVTAKATFGAKEVRYGRFEKNAFIASLSTGDPLGVTTLVGAKVGNDFVFAHLAVLQESRTGKRRDGTALGPLNADAQPNKLVLAAGGGLYKADVAIVMDTTGSMGGSIADLVSSLVGKILPELRRQIPDIAFGLVEHKDYPVSPYGGTGDFPVKLHREITDNVESVRTALASLSASGGSDLPESQVPAMFHALTGAELKWSSGSVPKREPPAGKLGAIGFRPGALPIVVLVTDIDWHEATHDPYSASTVPDAVTREQLADAFNGLNAKFINVTQTQMGRTTEEQPDWLSDKTASNVPVTAFQSKCGAGKCCTGVSGAARDPSGPDGRCRLNFLHNSGEGLTDSVITGISGLSIGTSFDVSAKITASGIKGPDASKLITAVRPVAAGDATIGCLAHDVKDTNGDGTPDTFVAVPVTDNVCFEVDVAKNTTINPTGVPQIAWAFLDLIGNPGQVLLDRRVVMIVVPPKS